MKQINNQATKENLKGVTEHNLNKEEESESTTQFENNMIQQWGRNQN